MFSEAICLITERTIRGRGVVDVPRAFTVCIGACDSIVMFVGGLEPDVKVSYHIHRFRLGNCSDVVL